MNISLRQFAEQMPAGKQVLVEDPETGVAYKAEIKRNDRYRFVVQTLEGSAGHSLIMPRIKVRIGNHADLVLKKPVKPSYVLASKYSDQPLLIIEPLENT